jgi:hypothetical protein
MIVDLTQPPSVLQCHHSDEGVGGVSGHIWRSFLKQFFVVPAQGIGTLPNVRGLFDLVAVKRINSPSHCGCAR